MKKLLFTLTLVGALALGGQSALAQAKKKAAAPADVPAAAPGEKPKAAADATKPVALRTIVDSIDAAGKSFSHKNKDGKEVKNIVTSKTDMKNGDKEAKFEDIKVGNEVKGTRTKKSDGEYEVLKITYIGAPDPKAPKAEGEAKKPAAEAKKPAAEATKPAAEPKKK